MDSSLHMHIASLKIQDDIRRASSARLAKQAVRPEANVTTVKTGASPWLAAAALLIGLGLVAIEGAAASIILAAGFLALFGAAIRVISRNEPTRPAGRRIPAGHSGV
jgi:VIT1/CCC1 family predicted Fe2+/Mn2+ transporter